MESVSQKMHAGSTSFTVDLYDRKLGDFTLKYEQHGVNHNSNMCVVFLESEDSKIGDYRLP